MKSLKTAIASTRTDLPVGLLQELQSIPTTSTKRSSLGLKSKDRKQDRKRQRLEKKSKRAFYHASETQKEHWNADKKMPKRMIKKPAIAPPAPRQDKEIAQLKKLESSNPDLYQHLIDSQLVQDPSRQSNKDQDDDELKRYQSLLKIKNGKLPASFVQDGLDELLGDLGVPESDGYEDIQEDSMSEDFDMQDLEDENVEREELDSTDDESETSELGIAMEESTEPIQDEPVPAGKYVPPHLRAKPMDETRVRLQRQLKGLINRLSDTNLESILAEIDELNRQHSRRGIFFSI